MSVSLVARQEGVSASLLFQWRKLERQDALTSVSVGEAVVPASELAAACAEIAKLQRVLGKKTLDNEILKEVALRDARTMLAAITGGRCRPLFSWKWNRTAHQRHRKQYPTQEWPTRCQGQASQAFLSSLIRSWKRFQS